MTPEELRQRLGGYATGNLGPEEEQELLAAALEDQELFNLLMAEQPVKELLDDPAARRELLAALDEPPSRWKRWTDWMRRPLVWGLAGSLAALVVTVGVVQYSGQRAALELPKSQVTTAVAPPLAKPPESPGASSAPKRREETARRAAPASKPLVAPRDFPAPAAESAPPVGETQDRAAAAPPPPPAKTVMQQMTEAPAVAERKAAPMAGMSAFRAAVPAPATLHATLQKLTDAGVYASVSPVDEFHAGDILRLEIRTPIDGSLDVLQRDASGAWQHVFPQGSIPVTARGTYLAPVAVRPGEQQIKVVLSSAPDASSSLLATEIKFIVK